ncbi:unnamed protein product [Amoebophrya sp. A25]|nr:unnamed protein product [Amoebophrya sp. A25]|eukprot:GSA25T00003083001.1
MAEEHAKWKRFEYRTNSNLVLQREGAAPSANEPTGEPESLRHFNLHRMGDLARPVKEELAKLKEKTTTQAAKRMRGAGEGVITDTLGARERREKKKQKLDVKKGQTVLDADVSEVMPYKPSTQQTRVVYEELLAVLGSVLGDQSPEVLQGGADEVLAAIKADNCLDAQRKRNVEEVLGVITEQFFAELYRLAKQITDYGADEKGDGEKGDALGADDATGVAVVFEEEESDGEDKYVAEISDSDEDSENSDDNTNLLQNEDRGIKVADDDEQDEEEEDKEALHVSQIDAHWLQREINSFSNDHAKAVELEKKILKVLAISDLQILENELVKLLEFQNFDFLQKLVKNRSKILYITRLKQAQTEEEQQSILEDMRGSTEGMSVLAELDKSKAKRDKERDEVARLRQEARALMKQKKGDGEAAGGFLEDLGTGGQDKPGATTDAAKKLQPSRVIDLEHVAFAKGGHTMTNAKCNLTEGATRIQAKSWEEVHIPAPPAPEHGDIDLISIQELPKIAHPAFKNDKNEWIVQRLNPVQSKVYPVAFKEFHENMLICAPTGAGKTNIALLAILNVLMANVRKTEEGEAVVESDKFKIVYIAPMKALVQQLVGFFAQRFERYGLSVGELSGDSSLSKEQIARTQILVTTPEKWDIITRKSGDARANMHLVRLLIIDEVHLLHDTRGPVLEAIVARTLRQIERTQEPIRLVALSATLPNYTDVAAFLRVSERGLFKFDNRYRPCPLEQTFIGVTDKKAVRRLNTMNEVCFEKVVHNAGKHQMLIFVHSRKETGRTAKTLREMAMERDVVPRFLAGNPAAKEILAEEAKAAQNAELRELLPYGFAIHHAGLSKEDRLLVEELFSDKHIQVLCCTSTLAWGVNLPAHTVIIKGTQVYKAEEGKWDELGCLDMLQMMGRAGRPGYEKQGHGIIITQHSELQYYLSLMNMQLPIESQMVQDLPDKLIGELVLGTVQNRQDAVTWLGYTYLFVRMQKNPQLYSVQDTGSNEEADPTLLQARCDLVHAALSLLNKHNLIRYDRRTGHIQVTAMGRVASHYYIKHPSIAVYNENLRPNMNDIELLRLFSLSFEFKNIPVRDDEKVELAKLLEKVPIPVKGSADEYTAKVNVLLQAYISKMKLEGFAMAADMVYIEQSAGRIMRALFEMALRKGWASLALRCLKWCKMIEKRMWSCQTPLRHFKEHHKGLAEDILRRMEKRDLAWDKYYELSPSDLATLTKLPPKFGKVLHKAIHQFPKVDLFAYVQPKTRSCLMVELTLTPDFQWEPKIHGSGEVFWVIVEDVNGEHILHYEQFLLKQNEVDQEHTLTFTVPITEPKPPQYFLRLVSDRWLNSETLLAVSFRNLILPEKSPAHTELLDLQPLPVSALRYKDAAELFYKDSPTFNPIQTQTFSCLYSSNDNALICAPAAAGKDVCMEFTILRMLQNGSDHPRCVYLAPYERMIEERFNTWAPKFSQLGVAVAKLTGEVAADLRIIQNSNLVITTPEKFDMVSRRHKAKKGQVIQELDLLLCDELHLLEDPEAGPIYEAVVSRMRFVTMQTGGSLRIVGFAASLANAKDVTEWIGASFATMYNFSPSVRSVPLELMIHGFDIHNRMTRLQSMSRPVYQALKSHSPNKPCIVFVSDRKQCRVAALDLLLNAASDDTPKRFLRVKQESIEPYLKTDFVQKRDALARCLAHGVGYIHEGFSAQEIEFVCKLYRAGALQVLVAAQSLAYGMTEVAHLVVVMDTVRYDGREGRFVDYPVADLLQMIGRASRPNIDNSGLCVLLLPASKKEYYKKFVFEALPVESHLDQRMADILNVEIVMKNVENKQDALDWLTWSFYYRRLAQNPNYYGLQGVSHTHLSDHLSEVVEQTVDFLEQAGCTAVEDEINLSAANLGLVASYYALRYTTIEVFSRCVSEATKRKGIIDILADASEFEYLPLRQGEDEVLKKLALDCGVDLGDDVLKKGARLKPTMKSKILLYAHFHRAPLTIDLAFDQKFVLENVLRIVQGLVDVISSNSNLKQSIMAMEVSQMIVQGTLHNNSPLLQLPHLTPEMCEELRTKVRGDPVEDIFAFAEMEDEDRENILGGKISEAQMAEIAKACNRYPSVELSYNVDKPNRLEAGGKCKIVCNLVRDMDDDDVVTDPVYAPRFPKEKDESWWALLGDVEKNFVVCIKRISFTKKDLKFNLQFELGEEVGARKYMLYLMCDSYQGIDQEHEVEINVQEG